MEGEAVVHNEDRNARSLAVPTATATRGRGTARRHVRLCERKWRGRRDALNPASERQVGCSTPSSLLAWPGESLSYPVYVESTRTSSLQHAQRPPHSTPPSRSPKVLQDHPHPHQRQRASNHKNIPILFCPALNEGDCRA